MSIRPKRLNLVQLTDALRREVPELVKLMKEDQDREMSPRTEEIEQTIHYLVRTQDTLSRDLQLFKDVIGTVERKLIDTENRISYYRLKADSMISYLFIFMPCLIPEVLKPDHWVVISDKSLLIQTTVKKEALAEVRKSPSRCLLLRVGHEKDTVRLRVVNAKYDTGSWYD